MLTPEEQEIVDRYKHPRFTGSIGNPTVTADGINASCGDEVHLEATISDGVFTSVRHQTRGCAICTAATDILAEHLEQKSEAYITTLTAENILSLLPISVSPARLKCALLALDAVKRFKKGSN